MAMAAQAASVRASTHLESQLPPQKDAEGNVIPPAEGADTAGGTVSRLT